VPLGEGGSLRYRNNHTTANYCPEECVKLRARCRSGETMINRIHRLWADESGQDVAEYAVMLAVILVIVIGTVKLIGSNANNVFSQVASTMTQ